MKLLLDYSETISVLSRDSMFDRYAELQRIWWTFYRKVYFYSKIDEYGLAIRTDAGVGAKNFSPLQHPHKKAGHFYNL